MLGISGLVKKRQSQDTAAEEPALSQDSAARDVRLANIDESELAAAFARGRAAFADLLLELEVFARHLRRVVAHIGETNALSGLAIEDLFLACACLEHVPGAAEQLLERHRG